MDIQNYLMEAVKAKDLITVRALLQTGANPNYFYMTDDGFDGMLIHRTESAEIAEQLIMYGADVNARDWFGSTPLLRAIEKGCVEVIKVLLNNNASVGAMNGLGECVLPCAIRYHRHYGNLEIIKLLIYHGAIINDGSWNSFPPLHLAVMCNKTDIVEELVKQGAHLELRDVRGVTPLHFALTQPLVKLETIKLLLELGADPNNLGPNNENLLDVAIVYRDAAVLHELLEFGADANVYDRYCRTPLYRAVLNPSSVVKYDIVHELLRHRAKPGLYAPDVMHELEEFTSRIASPVRYAVTKHKNSSRTPLWVELLVMYSTIDHLGIYEYYSTNELSSMLGNIAHFAINCMSELSKMRAELINDKSMLDYLKAFIKSNQLTYLDLTTTGKIFDSLVRNNFLIYGNLITEMISREFLFEVICNRTLFTISSNSKKIRLNFDVVRIIAKDLSKEDLLNLLKAFHEDIFYC